METNRLQRLRVSFLGVWLMTGAVAMAIDVGDPFYHVDGGKWVFNRLEVLYEKYDRDAVAKTHDLRVIGPGAEVSIPRSGDDSGGRVEADVYMLRLNILLFDKFTGYLNGGVLDYSDAQDKPYILGGGVRFNAYEKNRMRLNVVGTAHYVPSFDVDDGYAVDDFLGPAVIKAKVDYYEVAAGPILSGNLLLNANARLMPYGGLLLSFVRGTEKIRIQYPFTQVTAKTTDDIEEDSPIVAVAGVSVLLKKNFSLRLEGRLIGESSVSEAVGYAF